MISNISVANKERISTEIKQNFPTKINKLLTDRIAQIMTEFPCSPSIFSPVLEMRRTNFRRNSVKIGLYVFYLSSHFRNKESIFLRKHLRNSIAPIPSWVIPPPPSPGFCFDIQKGEFNPINPFIILVVKQQLRLLQLLKQQLFLYGS